MLTITIQVNAPSGQAIGIKEDIATYLEKFGDAKVVSVVEKLPEHLRMRLRAAKQGASAASLNAAPPGERSQARGNAE